MENLTNLSLREIVAVSIGKGVLAEFGFDYWPVVDKVTGCPDSQYEGAYGSAYYAKSAQATVRSATPKFDLPPQPKWLPDSRKADEKLRRRIQAAEYAIELEHWLEENVSIYGNSIPVCIGMLPNEEIAAISHSA